MSPGQIEPSEEFENAFWYFLKALRVLSHDAEAQCEEMDNYNAPWEIQNDVAEGSLALLRSSTSYLTWEQTERMTELATALRALPQEAIAPKGMVTTNHAGCFVAMNHPAWVSLREIAEQLLVLLEPAIKRNEAFFQNQ